MDTTPINPPTTPPSSNPLPSSTLSPANQTKLEGLRQQLAIASPAVACHFPFALTDDQAIRLLNFSDEEWLQHAKKVRANHPRNSTELDIFLGLPIETIVATFQAEVVGMLSPIPKDRLFSLDS
jgi:hypothetical protein